MKHRHDQCRSPREELSALGTHIRKTAHAAGIPCDEFVDEKHILAAMQIIVRFPHSENQLKEWELAIAAALGLFLRPTREQVRRLLADGTFSEQTAPRSREAYGFAPEADRL